MSRAENDRLLVQARQRLENLTVEFKGCDFTYTNLPNLPSSSSTNYTNNVDVEAGSSSSDSSEPRKPKTSTWKTFKENVKNKKEKVMRKAKESATGKKISRKFSKSCIFRPSHKIIVQNYINSLNLECQVRFIDCKFLHRESTILEILWKLILNCFGGPSFTEYATGIVLVENETFRLDELPSIVDKVILNVQENASEPFVIEA